jgi:2-iminobutanoate/2-iminopropanoate deaminase
MNKTVKRIETKEAPAAIGPYSQAIFAAGFFFVSGQLPINPKTGVIEAITIQEQTLQVLANIAAILKAQNLNFENVVRTEIYLKELADFKEVNAIYAQHFTSEIKPARQTMQVARLPLDALIEISCIAISPLA